MTALVTGSSDRSVANVLGYLGLRHVPALKADRAQAVVDQARELEGLARERIR